MTSDGTEDNDDDVCVGYPEHRGVRETYRGDDGIQWECTVCGAEGWEDAPASDGIPDRRVAFIGHPSAGKTTTASCCGERDDIPVAEEVLEIPLPGFVGMIHGGREDIARRAKDIVRGTSSSDGTVCKCPFGAHDHGSAQ